MLKILHKHFTCRLQLFNLAERIPNYQRKSFKYEAAMLKMLQIYTKTFIKFGLLPINVPKNFYIFSRHAKDSNKFTFISKG